MSETKWTPGPWPLETVETSVGSCHKIGAFPSAGVRKEVPACVYADRLRLGLDDQNPIAIELLANARLIAAAPELYEALVKLLAAYEGVMSSEFDFPGNPWTAKGRNDVDALNAHAVLAKARGEA